MGKLSAVLLIAALGLALGGCVPFVPII